MSCSNVIDTYTNARYIYRGVSRWRQRFQCGKCDGCVRKQRTDWRVRTYYESLSCLRKSRSSFVLFDTLTYADAFIKKYSDLFPDMDIPGLLDKHCFSRDDVQKFFKRLRINLKRSGYRFSPQGLRYILTSEYGTSEETNGFKNTHRPHYHILFFVDFSIDPIEFSRFVSRSWFLGKTDGVRPFDDCEECHLKSYCRGRCIYQSPQYVRNERLITTDSRKNCIKCCNYVTKYISKDMYMGTMLQDNVDLLWSYLYPGFRNDIFQYRSYRRFCSQVLPFHLQSQGFGLDLLRDEKELEYLLRTDQVHLPTGGKDVIRSVALPRYYQRKLYYYYEKIDGRVVWKLTDFGVESKVRHLDRKIASFMRDYKAYDPGIPGSQLYDLALYNLVYRGTLSDYGSLFLSYRDYYRKMISPHDSSEQPLYYNFNTKKDKLTIGRFLSTRCLLTPDGEIVYKGKQIHRDFQPFDGYQVVTDKVCPYWIGFDRKLAAYEHWRKNNAVSADVLAIEDAENLDYYKRLGLISSG